MTASGMMRERVRAALEISLNCESRLMFRVPALAFLFLALFTSLLRAQSTNASLTGRITDPSRALIVDAKIAAIGTGTNVRHETTTSGSGEYYLANLPPGSYRIEIEKPGFKKLIKPDVTLHVQDALAIDFEMTLGAVSETVTVQPGAPLYPGGKILNEVAFSAAPVGQQGDFGRNVLRGFGVSQLDVGFHRQFRLTEGARLRFQAEFFNIFSHPTFGGPNNSLTSPLFGHSTQTLANSLGSGGANGGFNPLYQIGGPRSIQFALKLQF